MVRVYIYLLPNIDSIIKGTVRANKTSGDFNQTIPAAILQDLFENPVNLSNLHQTWFMNKTQKYTSNIDVAIEIYLASVRPNNSYVDLFERVDLCIDSGVFLVVSISGEYQELILWQK